jgi:hypothetical protein
MECCPVGRSPQVKCRNGNLCPLVVKITSPTRYLTLLNHYFELPAKGEIALVSIPIRNRCTILRSHALVAIVASARLGVISPAIKIAPAQPHCHG